MKGDEWSRRAAAVYRSDTYRVCRDGKRHFRMHYVRGQCMRFEDFR